MPSCVARIAFTLATVSALSAATLPAQTGVLVGAILDQTNRSGLQGVVVRIVGTDLLAVSDFNGKFTLRGVPAGARRLEAQHDDYISYRLAPLRISATDTNRVTFAMAFQRSTVTEVSWTMNAEGYRGRNGQRFDVRCPPGGSPASTWGTDVYTDDSSVCTAAAHAGRITFEAGGVVSFEIAPGMSSYTASSRNGFATSAFGEWQGSFIIR